MAAQAHCYSRSDGPKAVWNTNHQYEQDEREFCVGNCHASYALSLRMFPQALHNMVCQVMFMPSEGNSPY